MEEIKLHVEAEVRPTEAREKVEQAIRNVFGDLNLELKPLNKSSILVGEGKGKESLSKLCEILRRERVRSAARVIFLRSMESKTLKFCLNKQVAFAGHFSFSEDTSESPLGPIRVRIDCPDPRGLVEWLAPKAP